MSFTLNETEWAKSAIEQKMLGKSPYETLRRVARYYIDEGYQRDEVRTMVEDFILECDQTASVVKWTKTVDAAMQFALKHEAVKINCIPVTQAELERVSAIESGRQEQRLAFTLMCLAKYWNHVCGNDTNWVNSKDTDVMRMANIKTSIKRQCRMYHSLREKGLISFSRKVDCNHVRVDFIENDSPIVLMVDDFRDLGNQYLMFLGEPYFKCAECGAVEKMVNPSRGRNQKYCTCCAALIKTRRSVDSVMRKRDNA